MGSLWALNVLIALMLRDGRSYMFFNLNFYNSFSLGFDWLLENNGMLFAFNAIIVLACNSRSLASNWTVHNHE